jgi:hypothetical protein
VIDTLFVVIGEMIQIERYTLKNIEGHWLIDGQEIQENHVIGRTIERLELIRQFC